MNGSEMSELMKPLVERLEREPRFSLAFTLAYEFVMQRVYRSPVEEWPAAIEKASQELVAEVRKTNGTARIRRRTRGLANLLDRVERLKRGEKLPDKRRRRRRKAA